MYYYGRVRVNVYLVYSFLFHLECVKTEQLHDEQISLSDIIEEGSSYFQKQNKSVNVMKLETFSAHNNTSNQNIVPMDSDSDMFGSCDDSFLLDDDEKQAIVDSIVSGELLQELHNDQTNGNALFFNKNHLSIQENFLHRYNFDLNIAKENLFPFILTNRI